MTVKKNIPTIGNLIDNFNFALVGARTKFPFRGYNSTIDPTDAPAGTMIRGAQNCYKSLRGTIAWRPGLKRYGLADSTIDGVVWSYEWNTALAGVRPMRVLQSGELQVEWTGVDGVTPIWYTLLTDMGTRGVMDPWWDDTEKKDRLILVDGTSNLQHWSGGIGIVASASAASGIITTFSDIPNADDGTNQFFSSGGVGYVVGDVLTISAGNSDAQLTVKSITSGGVGTAVINAVGSGYAANDLVQITGAGGNYKATLKILTVDGSGAVLTFSIVTAGIGYSVGSGFSTTPITGSGIGLTVNISSVGNTITAWTLTQAGSGYSAASSNVSTTGGTGIGATVNISGVATGAITLQQTGGVTNLSQLGFASNTAHQEEWVLTIGGTDYTYMGTNANGGLTFTGVTPGPAALVAGTIVTQKVLLQANVPAGTDINFTNDFIRVINNQLHVGCYKSRFVYVSSNTDFRNFTVPATRAQGDPDLLTLDSNVRGIGVQKGTAAQAGNAVISGGIGDWYTIVRSQITVGSTLEEDVTVTKSESADLATALGHEFIENIGDTIIFVDQNNQLREFGTVRNITNPVYPLLSLDVFNELKGLNLTGGHVRAVADESGETIYIVCPSSGVHYMYQIRQDISQQGNLVAERLWQPPQICGVSRIAVINGLTYGHSNANPQIYQLWDTNQYHDDSPSDEPLPYEVHTLMAYLNNGGTAKCKFDKLFAEGYMTLGSVVGCTIFQEYQGSKNAPSVVINNPAKGQKIARFYSGITDISLGQSSLGDNPIGDGLTPVGGDDATLPKFRCIRGVTGANVFEYALDMFSNTADTRVELLALGVNQVSVEQQPAELQKSS